MLYELPCPSWQSGALHGYFVNASTFRSADPNPRPLMISTGKGSSSRHAKNSAAGAQLQVGSGRRKKPQAGVTVGQEEESVVDVFGRELAAKGFNYFGTEKMYSGIYGNEMECDIYIGVVYYQRLRHMVSDKFQVRSTELRDGWSGCSQLVHLEKNTRSMPGTVIAKTGVQQSCTESFQVSLKYHEAFVHSLHHFS